MPGVAKPALCMTHAACDPQFGHPWSMA